MKLFGKSALEAAQAEIEKAQSDHDRLRAQAGARAGAVKAAETDLERGRAAAIEAAERGDEPPSLTKLNAKLIDAQDAERASSTALTKAEGRLGEAQVQLQAVRLADARERQMVAVNHLLEALHAAVEAEALAIAAERAMPGLPHLSLGHFTPAPLASYVAHLEQAVSRVTTPKAPEAPRDLVTVTFVQPYAVGASRLRSNRYQKGERASFAPDIAQFLIGNGIAEAA